jgi:hypothetical protein
VGRQGRYDGGGSTLGVRRHGSTFVLGESWAKDLMTVRPVGAAFPVGSVVFHSIMSSMGKNLVHILDKRWRRYWWRTLPEGVAVGMHLSHDIPFNG